ncbi:Quinone oxidoreductase 2 [Baekduia alba]|uniref:SDR family oxidoreductase n=1 Tax=Baekduia alba TaxID=2997333 RepID=UPI002340524B|nr:SDR family oxidoreductase [Baekduia alba]WCB95611.1 Quinone oxidoreductase 2 [Baekduia alba]
MKIAVTGATGGVGSRVARRLVAAGAHPRLVVRDLARVEAVRGFEAVAMGPRGYRDQTELAEALAGCSTLLLVSAREAADRVVEHAHAVRAAIDAGVTRIVYTSFLGADPDATFTFAQDHHATEQLVRESGAAWTFLRDSQYADFVPALVGEDGVIRGPAGEGRVAWVARDDVADVATAVLLAEDGSHDGETYTLTGPEAQTLAWAAERLSELTGRAITFRNQSVQGAYESRAHVDAPDYLKDGWVTSYVAVGTGEMDVVSDAVERIAGHPPIALPAWLAAHPEAWAHLKA